MLWSLQTFCFLLFNVPWAMDVEVNTWQFVAVTRVSLLKHGSYPGLSRWAFIMTDLKSIDLPVAGVRENLERESCSSRWLYLERRGSQRDHVEQWRGGGKDTTHIDKSRKASRRPTRSFSWILAHYLVNTRRWRPFTFRLDKLHFRQQKEVLLHASPDICMVCKGSQIINLNCFKLFSLWWSAMTTT